MRQRRPTAPATCPVAHHRHLVPFGFSPWRGVKTKSLSVQDPLALTEGGIGTGHLSANLTMVGCLGGLEVFFMRPRRLKAPTSFPIAHYHCMFRVVNRDFVFAARSGNNLSNCSASMSASAGCASLPIGNQPEPHLSDGSQRLPAKERTWPWPPGCSRGIRLSGTLIARL